MTQKLFIKIILVFITPLIGIRVAAQKIAFTVSMDQPSIHIFHVTLACSEIPTTGYLDFKMPTWTPGYYQKLDYAGNVDNFRATDVTGRSVKWERINDHT